MKFPISMTAFGRGEHASENIGWTVEIKSVNHRFCDIRIKMPRQYAALEEKIKKEITPFYSRGHIEVVVPPPRTWLRPKPWASIFPWPGSTATACWRSKTIWICPPPAWN